MFDIANASYETSKSLDSKSNERIAKIVLLPPTGVPSPPHVPPKRMLL